MSLPITKYRYRALDATVQIGAHFEARIYRNLSKNLPARKKSTGGQGSETQSSHCKAEQLPRSASKAWPLLWHGYSRLTFSLKEDGERIIFST